MTRPGAHLGADDPQERLKLTAYFGERDRTPDGFVADALLELYGRHRIEVSVLLRGTAGFGVKHHLHTDVSVDASDTSKRDIPFALGSVSARGSSDRATRGDGRVRPRGAVHRCDGGAGAVARRDDR